MNKKVTYPGAHEDITIEQYRHILSLRDRKDTDHQIVAYLTGLTLSEVKRMAQGDLDKITSDLEGVLSAKKNYELQTFVELEGKMLAIDPAMNEITAGAFADLEMYSRKLERNLDKFVSVLYRPVTERNGQFYKVAAYTGNEYKDRDYSKLSFSVAMGAAGFFLTCAAALRINSASFLKAEPEASLEKNTGGNRLFTTLRAVTSLKSRRSRN